MKKIMMMCAVALAAVCAMADQWTDPETGITWTYSVFGGARVDGIPKSTAGDITVPSSLGGHTVTRIGASAFSRCEFLTHVTVPDSVGEIGQDAFSDCIELVSVDLPSNLFLGMIEDRTFYNCAKLKSVVIPEGVLSIGNDAFFDCRSLEHITIPQSVSLFGLNVFSGCSSLGEGVVVVDGCVLVSNPPYPTSLTLKEGVRLIVPGAFQGCSTLETISIPSTLKSISGNPFAYAVKLKTITVSSGNPTYVSKGGVLVDRQTNTLQCYPAGRVGGYTIPSGTVTIGVSAFSGCKGLTDVTIPSSVVNIGHLAFRECSGLTGITIPSSVANIGSSAFSACDGLVRITIPSGIARVEKGSFIMCKGLEHAIMSPGVGSIRSGAFFYCRALTGVSIPSSVVRVDHDAFEGCALIDTVHAERGDSERLRQVLADCKISGELRLLDHVTIVEDYEPGPQPSPVPRPAGDLYREMVDGIEWTFMVGEDLQASLGLDDIVIDLVTDTVQAIPRETKGAIAIPSTLGCRPVKVIAKDAFFSCAGLTEVRIPDSVVAIGSSAFSQCEGLEHVSLPSNLTSIEGHAFLNCSALKDLVVPVNVVSIGDRAFYRCSEMTDMSIPSSVIEVCDETFYGCSELAVIHVERGDTARIKRVLANCIVEYYEPLLDQVTIVEDYEPGPTPPPEPKPAGGPYKGVVDGLVWTFMVKDGEACVGGVDTYLINAIPTTTAGAVVIPTTLGGHTVTSIGMTAFSNCSVMEGITIPDSIVRVGVSAFWDCSSLNAVDFEGAPPSGLENASINPDAAIRYNVAYQAQWLPVIKQCGWTNAKPYSPGPTPPPGPEPKPEGGPYTEKVGSVTWTFMVDSGLGAVVGTGEYEDGSAIPTSTKGAVTIPSELGGRTVTGINDFAFVGCDKVTSVTIPASVTSVGIGNGAVFVGCTSLIAINVAAGNEWYASVGGVLFSEGELVQYPIGKKGSYAIPMGVWGIRSGAFQGCVGLTSVTIPASVEQISGEIDGSSFGNCPLLTAINVAAENEYFASHDGVLFNKDGTGLWQCPGARQGTYVVPSGVTYICEGAFSGCKQLTVVTIMSGVTDIGWYAFLGCGMKAVSIPSSVEYVGENAFFGCDALEKVYVDEGDEDRVRGLMEDSGFDTTQVEFCIIGETPTFEVIAGMSARIDVGFVGYTAKNLPKGLSFNSRTGLVTGTTKTMGTFEATFTKKGEWEEEAIFVVRAEKKAEIDSPVLEAGDFTAGVAGAVGGISINISSESGVKSVSSKNLPSGMKLVQDKTTKEWSIAGAPTKTGSFSVTLTVVTGAGNKVERTFNVTVAALPEMAIGTFNGFVTSRDENERFDRVLGPIQVTTTDAGRVTAKVTTTAKTYTFSAAYWDKVADGRNSVIVTLKTGETLSLELDSNASWDAHQLEGYLGLLGGTYDVSAQRIAFGKTWYFDAVGDETEGWELSYTINPKTAALTLTLNADGKTSLSGKLVGGTTSWKISASGYSDVSGLKDGAIIADFAPVITVNRVKRILSIHTNLWFDRTNDHEFIGSAKVME